MEYTQASEKLAAYRKNIAEIRAKMRATLAETEPEEVRDYEFSVPNGKRRLSDLFGEHDRLFMIHNMGRKCPYCTLWADGFSGVYHHLADRASFVVSSPDPPAAQKEVASDRGWRFPMVSHQGTTFAADMGYGSENDGWMPGISVFRRDGERIVRLSDTSFHPFDDFSTVWHLFDMLPEGPAGWSPKLRYR